MSQAQGCNDIASSLNSYEHSGLQLYVSTLAMAESTCSSFLNSNTEIGQTIAKTFHSTGTDLIYLPNSLPGSLRNNLLVNLGRIWLFPFSGSIYISPSLVNMLYKIFYNNLSRGLCLTSAGADQNFESNIKKIENLIPEKALDAPLPYINSVRSIFDKIVNEEKLYWQGVNYQGFDFVGNLSLSNSAGSCLRLKIQQQNAAPWGSGFRIISSTDDSQYCDYLRAGFHS
jgi:hypothetical protein